MKRTFLLIVVLLVLFGSGARAQGPLPLRVSTANARQFVAEQPQFADFFAFGKDGSAYCGEQAAFVAFLKFEQDHKLPSSLAVTSPTDANGKPLQEPTVTESAVGAIQAANTKGEDPLAALDREIAAVQLQLAGEPQNSDNPNRDRLQQLLNERNRLTNQH